MMQTRQKPSIVHLRISSTFSSAMSNIFIRHIFLAILYTCVLLSSITGILFKFCSSPLKPYSICSSTSIDYSLQNILSLLWMTKAF